MTRHSIGSLVSALGGDRARVDEEPPRTGTPPTQRADQARRLRSRGDPATAAALLPAALGDAGIRRAVGLG
ncbi:hypothetical protein GGTG_03820 [Gaeumannomyces tritici R3-111a-1]|uniref:Uncharacterized protein n=1 Tax=Gaeumannomyces tritici (strain R3-111a-1) TaxID=644352 RepID=J3NRB6_GAET3|nr:hypothetical protein GGTG_03820 [Gaeumannomyces tritici R3-111a-1]EJT78722.1 hypothetical protein GGTG_03820 [Gaeumannomyces tritici R3-111a-1]